MKPPSTPPFNTDDTHDTHGIAAKAAVTGVRPAFPARFKAGTQTPSALQLIAAPARAASANGQNYSKNTLQGSVFDGFGLGPAVRARMVRKLAAQGVCDAQVLAAMGAVERHRFVDTALAGLAYEDTSLPLGLGQTISRPGVVARMLGLLRQSLVEGTGRLGRVLEIGTGCGYQAALLSHLATEVYSIERLRGLHDRARENLRGLRLANVHLLFGDGMAGFAKGAPYAAIIAAAGGTEIPAAWLEQLAVGGRLVAPLQDASGAQALVVIDKTPQGIRRTLLEAVHFVPLKSGTN